MKIKAIYHSLLLGLCVSTASYAAPDAVAGKQQAGMCFNCHGAEGQSRSEFIPSLAAQKPAYIVNQLRAFRSGSRKNGMMQNIASNLSNTEMNNIAAYLASLPLKAAGGDKLQLTAGEKKVSNCRSCHGQDLQGAGLTPRLAGQHPAYLMNQLKAFKEGDRKNGMMRGVAMNLSDKDLYVITQYLGQLK